MSSIAARLRTLPALTGDLPEVDPFSLSADPATAFVDWLEAAIDVGVPEPHALGVSTVDADGQPRSRVVLLTDVVDGCWRFATDGRSQKALDLMADPRCALTVYWQPLGRQVRIVGRAEQVPEADRRADFLARSPSARASLLAGVPGQPLASVEDMQAQVRRARDRVDREPGLVAEDWQVWAVRAEEVEFWQGVSDRAHMRLLYRWDGVRWDRRLISP
ncbi:pyridoxine/pyridoxamine 5'-phosphate oxidase [Cellulomonas denverensis]|uniref:Pyridoxal 5'-phosphate synthase n=1 Tax=Cellulomonas denverensis TaxID=264297 RepID=A0A7X6KXS3_9CELL|nr:pyridoxal 5'-phosphate synthase [Cellulomonas denverensis]NKY24149.1 pyridoxal 5'-phosphate synthase [Cellulomonas denverensis]GIG25327.1 pyridoxamine 5'-phosphate oxidase [Cellulomonas denverensis]